MTYKLYGIAESYRDNDKVKIIDEDLSKVLGQKRSEVIDPEISSKKQTVQRAEALLRTIKDKEYFKEAFPDPSNEDRNLYKVQVLVSINKRKGSRLGFL